MPRVMSVTAATEGTPYSATTTVAVTIIGRTAPASQMTAVPEANFDAQMLDRATGFEATQPNVPRSRSATSSPIAAKIATKTKICDPTDATTLSSGTIDTGC